MTQGEAGGGGEGEGEGSDAPRAASVRSLPAVTWETIGSGAVAWLTNGMILPLLLVYLTAGRGLSPGFAGSVLAVATICGLVCQPVGGLLVDRIGPARAFSISLVISALGSLSLATSDTVPLIAAACVVSAVGRQMASATSQALLYSSVPERSQYATASAAQYMVTNGCSGAGGIIAGFTVDPDRAASFVVLFSAQTVILTAAALLLWFRLHRRVQRRGPAVASTRRFSILGNRGNRGNRAEGLFQNVAFRWAFTAAFLFPLVGNQQLFSGLPLHITRIGDQSARVVGLAFGANTYTVVFVQLLALRVLHRRKRTSVAAAMFLALALAWVAVLVADQGHGNAQASGYILAAALIGLGEVMFTLAVAPIPALAARPEQLGRYLSRYTMSRGVVQVIAPTMAGLLVDPLGGALLPGLLLAGTAACGVVIARGARKLPPDMQRI